MCPRRGRRRSIPWPHCARNKSGQTRLSHSYLTSSALALAVTPLLARLLRAGGKPAHLERCPLIASARKYGCAVLTRSLADFDFLQQLDPSGRVLILQVPEAHDVPVILLFFHPRHRMLSDGSAKLPLNAESRPPAFPQFRPLSFNDGPLPARHS